MKPVQTLDHPWNREQDEFAQLVSYYLDNVASEEEFSRLQREMTGDPDKQRLFVHLNLQFSLLHEALQGAHGASWLESRSIDDTQITDDSWLTGQWDADDEMIPTDTSQSPIPAPSPHTASSFLSTAYHGTIGFFSQELPFSLLIAAVLTSLGLWFASMIYVSSPDKIAQDSSPPVQSSFDPTLTVVGKITGMVDCKWADLNTETLYGANVLLGRKYALASGLMEITYDTGAKVILQGPVTYEVESNGGFLPVGKLTGKVENVRAKGFTIRTPTATVTDLGTEFGVVVDRQGITETHTFVGEVQIAIVGQRTGTETGQHVHVLHAGQTARLEGKKVVLVAAALSGASEERFVRTMPVFQPSLAADVYADLVLSLKPVVYYRLEPPQDEKHRNRVFDATGGGHDGILTFSEKYADSHYVSGRFGRSLALHGPCAGDHAIVPDYPKATNDRLTVSAWVMAIGWTRWPMIAANWGFRREDGNACTGQFHFGLFNRDGDLAAKITQPNGQCTEIREGASHPFPFGRWQHVAFVADGSAVHLYRNGRELASHPVAGILPKPPVASLGIGCRTNSAGTDMDQGEPCLWLGRIDELAIFNHALSAADIQRLSAAADHQTTVVPSGGQAGNG